MKLRISRHRAVARPQGFQLGALVCIVLAIGACPAEPVPERSVEATENAVAAPAETPPPPKAGPAVRISAALVRVIDGDTLRVRIDGREERVRYIGIDTPEVDHRGRDRSQPFGPEATLANARMVGTGPLRLEFDIERRDRYGRLLAYVYNADNTMINEALLREGLAQVLTVAPNVRHAERFSVLQTEARDAQRGLWAQPVQLE